MTLHNRAYARTHPPARKPGNKYFGISLLIWCGKQILVDLKTGMQTNMKRDRPMTRAVAFKHSVTVAVLHKKRKSELKLCREPLRCFCTPHLGPLSGQTVTTQGRVFRTWCKWGEGKPGVGSEHTSASRRAGISPGQQHLCALRGSFTSDSFNSNQKEQTFNTRLRACSWNIPVYV